MSLSLSACICDHTPLHKDMPSYTVLSSCAHIWPQCELTSPLRDDQACGKFRSPKKRSCCHNFSQAESPCLTSSHKDSEALLTLVRSRPLKASPLTRFSCSQHLCLLGSFFYPKLFSVCVRFRHGGSKLLLALLLVSQDLLCCPTKHHWTRTLSLEGT